MREMEGAGNSETRIDAITRGDVHWRYALVPIANDGIYPLLLHRAAGEYSAPLPLLAKGLAFFDPLSGLERQFNSNFLVRA